MNKCRKKPLPPYGAELIKLKSVNEIWIYIGHHSWQIAKNRHLFGNAVLVFPDNKLPEDYHWPVQKKEVLIFDRNPQGTDEILLKRLT